MAGSRCFACYASLLCELDAECFKLEGADLEGDAAVFRYRRFAAGVLHGGAGRDGARAAGHGQNGAGAHAPGLVQAHDDAIAVLGALHRLHHDARRVHGDEGVAFRQRAGAAVATTLGNILASIYYLWYFIKKSSNFSISLTVLLHF